MVQIFVSHSQYDTNIRNFFGSIIGSAKGLNPIFMEFENIEGYPAQFIKESIRKKDTKAVFVLLGPNITRNEYTKNWVAFEVGIATAAGKDVWVFEEFNADIQFPIPYLDHYMMYALDNREHFNYIKTRIQLYNPPAKIRLIMKLFGKKTKDFFEYADITYITCIHCKASYYLHNRLKAFRCPVCRQYLEFRV